MHDFDPRSFDDPRADGRGERARSLAETGRDLTRGGRGAYYSRDREHADPRLRAAALARCVTHL